MSAKLLTPQQVGENLFHAIGGSVQAVDNLGCHIEALTAERDALRADAERWREVFNSNRYGWEVWKFAGDRDGKAWAWEHDMQDDFLATIDAARSPGTPVEKHS